MNRGRCHNNIEYNLVQHGMNCGQNVEKLKIICSFYEKVTMYYIALNIIQSV